MKHEHILVVEDEYWIRKSICSLIEQVFGADVTVLESGNGEEALETLAGGEVSIVLTDINMPFMDGLALISYMTRQYPDIPVLVLSGYSDFPLVREALTGGALDYLLKPVKEADLLAAIEKAEKEMEKRQEQKRRDAVQQRQIEIYGDYVRDFIVSSYVCQKGTSTSFDPDETQKDILKEIPFPVYMAVIQKVEKKNDEDSRQSIWERRYAKKKEMKRRLDADGIWVIENVYRSDEYILLSSKEPQRLELSCLKLKSYTEGNHPCMFRICISGRIDRRENIPEAYKEMILKILCNAKYQKAYQYMTPDTAEKQADPLHCLSEEMEREITQALDQNNKAMLEYLLFDKLGIRTIGQEDWLLLEVKQMISRFRGIIHSYYGRRMDMNEIWEIDNLCDSIEMAVFIADTEEMAELFRQIIGILIHEENGNANTAAQGSDSIAKVIDYILEHYTENLTLSFLAEKFYLTPSYLSRSFKKQTGKNLVAFVTEKRLEKAMDYIKADGRSLTEIAFLAGYEDYTYFNKVFRRYLGISPTQYREQCKSKNPTSG